MKRKKELKILKEKIESGIIIWVLLALNLWGGGEECHP
jgi:hypothetical protein